MKKIVFSIFMMVAMVMTFTMCTKSGQENSGSASENVKDPSIPTVMRLTDVPESTNMALNDFAQVLADSAREIDDYIRSKEYPVTVVTVDGIGGDVPLDFAKKVGEKWGVGDKEKQDGVVILVKPKTEKSQGQLAIATGVGVQRILPYPICQDIINKKMTPCLQAGDYCGAVKAALDEIYERLDKAQAK